MYILFYTYTLLFISSIKITSHSNFFDLLTNVYINDFYLNNFYFLWTQFFLLPVLLVFLFYKHNIFLLKYKNTTTTVIKCLVLFIMSWWMSEYYLLNQYNFLFKNTQYFFNNLLYNPLNKYHPFLFFTSYIYIYSLSSYTHSFINYKTFTHIKHIYSSKFYVYYIKNNFFWILMSISLYLGSWWALQEGSWGGWWNWDASEVFGLLILTLLLIIFHGVQNYNNCLLKSLILLTMIIITSLLYCILQLSYTLVSHNFGLSLIGYGYVQSTFIVTTLLVLTLSIFISNYTLRLFNKSVFFIKLFYKTYFNYNNSLYIHPLKLHVIFTFIIITYIYIVSFNPIINNIFWNSFSLEILNKWFSWINVKLISIIILWLLLIKSNFFHLILYIFYNTYFVIYSLLFLPFFKTRPSLVKITHIFILIMLTTHLYLQYSFISYWEICNNSNNTWFNNYSRFTYRNNISIETVYIHTTINSLNQFSLESPISFFGFFNNINTQFFSLNLTENLLNQVLYNHSYLYTFKVCMCDSASFITDLFIIPIVVGVYKLYFDKLKIIF